jgi:acetyltransferase-like isoleucine patch superfamily enzyme
MKRFLGLSQKVNTVEKYRGSGNLVYGQNCRFSGLEISISGAVNDNENISIGDHCMLSGKIVLYSPNAKVTIEDGVFIGPDTTLFCYDSITIEKDTMISWGCTLIDTNAHSLHSAERKNDVMDWMKGPAHKNWSVVETKPIVVRKQSWIGFNSIITKGVELSEGTVIGCGSVVTKSTEAYSVYAGNPAVFIKSTD